MSVEQGSRRTLSVGLAVSIALGFTICLLGSSLKNTVQVFFLPMAETFGQSRGSFALATTVFAATYAVAAPVTGLLADRFGAGRVLQLGAVCGGAAFLLCASVPSFALFVMVYGVVAAFAYAMLSYIPMGVLVDRVFADGRKGFFYALLTNGTAAGFMLLVPLWTWLDGRHSWQMVLGWLGVFLLVVIAPLTGWQFSKAGLSKTVRRSGSVRPLVRAALSTTVFWRLAGAFSACGITMAFIDVHMIPYLHDHDVAEGISATSIVLLGAFEIGGSLLAGRLCDRGLIKSVLICGYLLRAGSMLLIAVAPHGPFVLLFGALFGMSYLVAIIATSLWVLTVFPVEVRGVLIGLMWTMHQIGAALSSQLGGLTHDSTGSYLPAILASGTTALVAAALINTLPPPNRSQADHQVPHSQDAR